MMCMFSLGLLVRLGGVGICEVFGSIVVLLLYKCRMFWTALLCSSIA